MNKDKLINLDQGVISALNFFMKNKPPRLDLKKFQFPIVVGSGNAYNTGKIIFSKQLAIFANESNFKNIIKSYSPLIKNKAIKQALIISASGEKDAVWELKLAKKKGLKTTLLTCNPDSSGAKVADEVINYKKIPEPYTYNISTYLGMVLSTEKEEVKKIKTFVKKQKLPRNFKKYKAYSFVLPDEFAEIVPMLDIKKNELFGPHLNVRAFTYGEARHAKFVIPWEKELVISLGKNKYFGESKHRWEINLPKKINNSLVMALTYYLIGKIQKSKPPYFKKNIKKFCQEGPKAYGNTKPFDVIVK